MRRKDKVKLTLNKFSILEEQADKVNAIPV
jgi:hypothetical protein